MSADKPGVIGTISIGGWPGHYTMRLGLTGPVIAKGGPDAIIDELRKRLLDAEARA